MTDRPSIIPPGTRARIVKAYDQRIVGDATSYDFGGYCQVETLP